MHGRAVFEQLDTSWPRGLVKAGRFAEGRLELANALRRVGFACDPLAERSDDDLAAAEGAWVVLLGTEMENGWSIFVVPTATLDDRARAALEACDRHVMTVDCPFDEPERYASFVHVLGLSGRVQWPDVTMVVEGSPVEGMVDEGDFEASYHRWAEHYVLKTTGAPLATALDRRIERVIEIYETP